MTRDRRYGAADWGPREFRVVDTGGLDPDAKKEGALPWNQQEQWETQGQFQQGAGTDHR